MRETTGQSLQIEKIHKILNNVLKQNCEKKSFSGSKNYFLRKISLQKLSFHGNKKYNDLCAL